MPFLFAPTAKEDGYEVPGLLFMRGTSVTGKKNKDAKALECRNPESDYFASYLNVDIHGNLHKDILCGGCPHGKERQQMSKLLEQYARLRAG